MANNPHYATDRLTLRRPAVPDQPVAAYTVVRAILSDDIDQDTDAVIAQAKAKGVTQPDADIRHVVNNVRSDMRRGRTKPGAKTATPLSAYTLAREALTEEPLLSTDNLVIRLKARGVTKKDPKIREIIRKTRGEIRRKAAKAPKPIPAPAAAVVTVPPAPAAAVVATDPFAGVRLANRTAQACGGIAKAREIAEAIRTVGGIDAFLERLDLVADILGSETRM